MPTLEATELLKKKGGLLVNNKVLYVWVNLSWLIADVLKEHKNTLKPQAITHSETNIYSQQYYPMVKEHQLANPVTKFRYLNFEASCSFLATEVIWRRHQMSWNEEDRCDLKWIYHRHSTSEYLR